MAQWYNQYLSIYGMPFSVVPHYVIAESRARLASLQSSEPLVSVVVIAYNESTRLPACLWALSNLKSKYPLEILGVNNNSKDDTELVKVLVMPDSVAWNMPRASTISLLMQIRSILLVMSI